MVAGQVLLQRIVDYLIYPTIIVIFTLGIFLFIYGIIEFLWKLRSGTVSPEGKQHMLWGILGIVIMVSVNAIVYMVMNTFGIDFANPDVNRINNITEGVQFFQP